MTCRLRHQPLLVKLGIGTLPAPVGGLSGWVALAMGHGPWPRAAPRSARCSTQDAYHEPPAYSKRKVHQIQPGSMKFNFGSVRNGSNLKTITIQPSSTNFQPTSNQVSAQFRSSPCGALVTPSSWSKGSSCAGREPRHSRLKALPVKTLRKPWENHGFYHGKMVV